jgi:curli biogenesis system outer membrane secretion channel CsgG
MFRLTFLALIVGLATSAVAQDKPQTGPGSLGLPPYNGPKKRAVVTAMEVKVQGVATSAPTPSGATTIVTLDLEQPTEFGTGLAEMLITSLLESERFVVLERMNLDDVRRELEIQGREEGPRMLGAQILVRGSITELKLRRSGTGAEGQLGEQITFARSRIEATVGLDLRIIEVDTGRILASVRAEGKAASTRQSFSIGKDELRFGSASFDDGPLGGAVRSAIREAVKKICERTEKLPWEGRVVESVDVDAEPKVYVNAGSSSGIKIGDLLTVERPGKLLVDPESEVVIGRARSTPIGRVKVVEVQENFCITEVVDGADFERGDVVRFAQRRAA